jgi:hypothetical protein
MIKTFTPLLSGSALRARPYPHTLSPARRRAPEYNPDTELSFSEKDALNRAMYTLTEGRIAQILALAASA